MAAILEDQEEVQDEENGNVAKPPLIATKNLRQASKNIRRIGVLKRKIARSNNTLARRVQKAKDQAARDQRADAAEVEALFNGVVEFAETNRDKITNGGEQKTIKLSGGVMRWYDGPPFVEIKDEDAVLERCLRGKKFKLFVRTNPSINRDAMLDNELLARELKGVSIDQREFFEVKPTRTRHVLKREVEDLKKVKVKGKSKKAQ